jgi:hypothetical protein
MEKRERTSNLPSTFTCKGNKDDDDIEHSNAELWAKFGEQWCSGEHA